MFQWITDRVCQAVLAGFNQAIKHVESVEVLVDDKPEREMQVMLLPMVPAPSEKKEVKRAK